jgi:hypothetical protein
MDGTRMRAVLTSSTMTAERQRGPRAGDVTIFPWSQYLIECPKGVRSDSI